MRKSLKNKAITSLVILLGLNFAIAAQTENEEIEIKTNLITLTFIGGGDGSEYEVVNNSTKIQEFFKIPDKSVCWVMFLDLSDKSNTDLKKILVLNLRPRHPGGARIRAGREG